ncbi:hypothetical protein [Deinococcus maricopensis]|uniref:Uncharacterized protein n=1 Tax=Deinococcus maricopensis (strain DSM 21211 / LMG 22137 / NRRL B-23946 / LB-34) TaxID=709986 RepID=E8U8Q3_DEIML|nr:hypothetical protein [Deinococcus maricopensis]ADV67442.1 hypothetical protein Deima_1794 [Deinococcus maricopensis DSM 21211]
MTDHKQTETQDSTLMDDTLNPTPHPTHGEGGLGSGANMVPTGDNSQEEADDLDSSAAAGPAL